VEFASEIDFEAINRLFSTVDKVIVKKQPISVISDCKQSFSCVISHLEQAPNQPSMLQFWMIADPMRYGLANNYGKVTEFLLKSFL
jgi:aspartate-semialdehyde dehydrogenase